jgi:hypothetical protein
VVLDINVILWMKQSVLKSEFVFQIIDVKKIVLVLKNDMFVICNKVDEVVIWLEFV